MRVGQQLIGVNLLKSGNEKYYYLSINLYLLVAGFGGSLVYDSTGITALSPRCLVYLEDLR